ncbi:MULTISPECIES: hypothetical protein [unclassified Archaeoglobus]|jgi:hypothetical protein|uniref:hypothetical protein n=1 Tax=unclassified Archaeoglobus TaxID=2643606 RepID=UPI0025C5D33A|nr:MULTISPECIES: hypothetical protein [unclassified Archaeoglobus]
MEEHLKSFVLEMQNRGRVRTVEKFGISPSPGTTFSVLVSLKLAEGESKLKGDRKKVYWLNEEGKLGEGYVRD